VAMRLRRPTAWSNLSVQTGPDRTGAPRRPLTFVVEISAQLIYLMGVEDQRWTLTLRRSSRRSSPS
jgi:hypothetical protein